MSTPLEPLPRWRSTAPIVAEVRSEGEPERVQVVLTGEIDQLNAAEMVDAVTPWLRTGIAQVTLDMSRVVFLDSGGLGRVIGLWKSGQVAGVPVRLTVSHQAVVALVDLVGLGRFMDVTSVPGAPA